MRERIKKKRMITVPEVFIQVLITCWGVFMYQFCTYASVNYDRHLVLPFHLQVKNVIRSWLDPRSSGSWRSPQPVLWP